MIDKFQKQLEKYNLKLHEKQLTEISKYIELLLEANEKISLVSNATKENLYLDHMLDSLSFSLLNLKIDTPFSLIDLGSGAGFPGIPVSILYPESSITLVESVTKKAQFLESVKNKLENNKLNVLNDRIELIAHNNQYRESFDFVTARALSNLNTLLEYALPFLKIGGLFVAYKTQKDLKSLKSLNKVLPLLGGKFEETIKYDLTGKDISRNLIVFKKVSAIPAKYPRKVGIPAKKPLHG